MKALTRKQKMIFGGTLCFIVLIVGVVKFISYAKEAGEYTKVISHTVFLRVDIEDFFEDNNAFPESLSQLAEYWDRDAKFIQPPFGAEVHYFKPDGSDPDNTVIYEAVYRGKKVQILKNFTHVDER